MLLSVTSSPNSFHKALCSALLMLSCVKVGVGGWGRGRGLALSVQEGSVIAAVIGEGKGRRQVVTSVVRMQNNQFEIVMELEMMP